MVYYFLQDKGAEYRGDLLYERAKAEFDARMEELAALPPKEILDHAYEKIIKEDFLCHLEEGLDEWETDALLSYPQPLAALYTEWMGVDYSYLKMTDIPYAPIYGDIVESRKKNGTPILKTTGVSRSGCMYCMYGVHLEHEPNRFQLMQVTHPQQYDYCINKLGCGAVLDYIGVPYRNQQLEVDHC